MSDQSLSLKAFDGSLPFWVATPKGSVFCWYHPAKVKRSNRQGVVLCNTFGSECMRLYPAYREIAMRLAEEGYPCLRFDYIGTNDSSGSPREPQLLSQWLHSLDIAIDTLKSLADLTTVNVFGALLGGTLALEVAKMRDDIECTFIWGAYLNGRSFLRTTSLQSKVIESNPLGLKPSSWQEGDEEAYGFLVSKAFSQSLSEIDLKQSVTLKTQKVLVLQRGLGGKEDAFKKYAERLKVDWGMVFHDDDLTKVVEEMGLPLDLIRAMLNHLDQHNSNIKTSVNSIPSSKNDTPDNITQYWQPQSEKFSEQVVFMGDQRQLFGVLSAPAENSLRNGVGILLINGGANHRVGINRNYTEWARQLSSLGYVCLRMDISGLGDTPARHREPVNTLYLSSAEEDVITAFEYLKNEWNLEALVPMGLCAGAYQAFRLIQARQDLGGMVLINPLRFMPPQKVEEGTNARSSAQQLARSIRFGTYVKFLFNIKHWELIGRWRQKRGNRFVLEFFINALKSAPLPFRFLKEFSKDDGVAQVFVQAVENKKPLLLICGETETILPYIKVALSSSYKRLENAGYYRYVELANSDHILSPLWSQEKVGAIVSEFLEHHYNKQKRR